MPRIYLKKARLEAGLTQAQLAAMLQVERKAVMGWEAGTQDPYPFQIPLIRGILGSNNEHLFDVQEEEQASFMDTLRRAIIDTVAKFGGATLVGNVSLQVHTGPVIEPEEYLALCHASIGTWWEWLNSGNFNRLERILNENLPILARLTNTLAPYQSIAAGLAVQAKIMQIFLATCNLDFVGRELHCAEAIRFGKLSGNNSLLAVALDWQGDTYKHCYNQPQRAIAIFNDALSWLDNTEVPLLRSTIYSDLSIAYAMDNTQDDHEIKARDFIELAHTAMPKYPELDPLHHCLLGPAEIDQQEGKAYLYLAKHLPTSSYAQQAYDTFEKSVNQQAINKDYLGQAHIRKADAARALGDKDELVKGLTQGFLIAIETDSKQRISEVHEVLLHIPKNWQRETDVQELQKELIQAITTMN